MWVFYYNFAINSSRCVQLCLNAYFVMVSDVSNRIMRVFVMCRSLRPALSRWIPIRLVLKNVVIKLFSDIKQEKIAEPPLSSSKRNERRSF